MTYSKNKSGEVYASIRERVRPPDASIVVMCKNADGKMKLAATPKHFMLAVKEGFDARIVITNIHRMTMGVLDADNAERFSKEWAGNIFDKTWFPKWVEVKYNGNNVSK